MTPLDPLDSAINAAASRLTNAKPSDALRANVMSRIAAEKKTSRFAWRFVLAGGAIATIALVAFTSLHNSAVPNPTIPTPTLINPTVINPTIASNAPSPIASVVRTASADDSGRLVFMADADPAGMSVPALEHPELMTPIKPLFDGAPVTAIDIEPIRMAPLTVRAIDDDNQ